MSQEIEKFGVNLHLIRSFLVIFAAVAFLVIALEGQRELYVMSGTPEGVNSDQLPLVKLVKDNFAPGNDNPAQAASFISTAFWMFGAVGLFMLTFGSFGFYLQKKKST